MGANRLDSDVYTESLRQRLHNLEKEQEILRKSKKELEEALEEDEIESSSLVSREDKEIAKWRQKVDNLKANFLEIRVVRNQELALLTDSIEGIKREIEDELSVEVTEREKKDDTVLDKLQRELEELEIQDQELISAGDIIDSTTANLENRLAVSTGELDNAMQAVQLVKENIQQHKIEIEEVAGEKAMLNVEMLSRLSNQDKHERGNGMFAELHDRKQYLMDKIDRMKFKLEEVTVTLEGKKVELQRKKESKYCSKRNLGSESKLKDKIREEYQSKIQTLKRKVDQLVYKFDEPTCDFPDSCSNEFEWIRVALKDASRKEMKAFKDCEELSSIALELGVVIDGLEEDIECLQVECEMLNEK